MDRKKLRQIIVENQSAFQQTGEYIEREVPLASVLKGDEAVLITGVRRCGKSTLLKLIAKKISGKKVFINFDDVRLNGFTIENFEDIEEISKELSGTDDITYFFDEIQDIRLWERWVNNLYAKKRKVFVTGSNATLLSSEMSTFLTGRNKVLHLYPFSFKEYLRFHMPDTVDFTKVYEKKLLNHFLRYHQTGGFPIIIKNDDIDQSKFYMEDIVTRDVISRYNIKNIKGFKDLLVYLFSNIGKTYTYTALKEVTKIKSLSTIKNYIDYLQNVFLLFTVERFDYSLRKQKVSSSKPYGIDNSFFTTVAFRFSENNGVLLENTVFLQLLRSGHQIYYHLGKKECDFVIKEGLAITKAIQVCWDFSHYETRKREIEGLLEAMRAYKLKEGLLLTLEQEEVIQKHDKTIIVMPVWKWLLGIVKE